MGLVLVKPNQTGHKIPNFCKWVTHSLPQFGDTEYNLHNLMEVSSCEERRVKLETSTSREKDCDILFSKRGSQRANGLVGD